MVTVLIFVPRNTNSLKQLMKQGVIRSLKAKYKTKMTHEHTNTADFDIETLRITMDAILRLQKSQS